MNVVRVSARGGDGGDGAVSFRREKYVPRGGPDGGDGGDGGSVYVVGALQLAGLGHLRRRRLVAAGRGGHGGGKGQRGADGKHAWVWVPVGSIVTVEGPDGGVERHEVGDDGGGVRVAVGGPGGRGNRAFAHAMNRAPLLAERGGRGEEVRLAVEVRLLADVGIVGKPGVGKSTLLRGISAARPEVGEYPFTTVEPVLGVVDVGTDSFVAAEIPGLVEGAHAGVGLGNEFLRHVERTKVLVHVVDGLDSDVAAALEGVRREMRAFRADLDARAAVVAVNRCDLPEVARRREDLKRAIARSGLEVWFISALTGEGVSGLVGRLLHLQRDAAEAGPRLDGGGGGGEERSKRAGRRARVERCGGAFRVWSAEVERMVERVNTDDWRVRRQLYAELRRLGVVRALEAAGVRRGDTVLVGGTEFVWE